VSFGLRFVNQSLKGGLGLRSLMKLNEAYNLKLCWHLLHSSDLSISLFSVITESSSWLLGNGASITFSSTVNNFLVNNHWLIPPILMVQYPHLLNHINKVSIPCLSRKLMLITLLLVSICIGPSFFGIYLFIIAGLETDAP
jgi:hypothetical protein